MQEDLLESSAPSTPMRLDMTKEEEDDDEEEVEEEEEEEDVTLDVCKQSVFLDKSLPESLGIEGWYIVTG